MGNIQQYTLQLDVEKTRCGYRSLFNSTRSHAGAKFGPLMLALWIREHLQAGYAWA